MPSAALTLTVNATGYNNGLWTSPGNALVSNNSYATIAPGTTSSRNLVFDTNATSVVPAGAVITGLELTAEYSVNSTTLGPYMQLGRGELAVGTTQNFNGTTTDTVYTEGGPTNPLGATSASQLSTVSMRVFQTSAGTVTHRVDNFTATVYWEMPSSNTLFFGENF